MKSLMPSSGPGYSRTLSSENRIVAGATPKVTSSAKESSSFPMGDDTFNRRADIPSKKSNTAPITIQQSANLASPMKANVVAIHPEMRLQQVILLGICFLIPIVLVDQLSILILQLSSGRQL